MKAKKKYFFSMKNAMYFLLYNIIIFTSRHAHDPVGGPAAVQPADRGPGRALLAGLQAQVRVPQEPTAQTGTSLSSLSLLLFLLLSETSPPLDRFWLL